MRSAKRPAVFGARASERRQEPEYALVSSMYRAQQSAPGGRIVRTIGIVRARAKIGLQNLAYNIRRLAARWGTARRGMKTVELLQRSNRSSGRRRAVKTAIKLKTAPDIMPLTRGKIDHCSRCPSVCECHCNSDFVTARYSTSTRISCDHRRLHVTLAALEKLLAMRLGCAGRYIEGGTWAVSERSTKRRRARTVLSYMLSVYI